MRQYLEKIYNGQDLQQHEMKAIVEKIVQGELNDIEITALLVGLKIKGESSDEIAGAATALRKACRTFNYDHSLTPVDTCGTGGDGMNTINISTMVALVAAECGISIVKHGNRSVSSKSGSSDLLQRLGIKLDCSPEVARQCLEKENFCFLFAPFYHSGVKHVMPVRQTLKTRTLFNLIGPLANPASPKIQLMGIYDPALLKTVAQALGQLGCEKAMVVHGSGLDEVALHGETHIAYLHDGVIDMQCITPEDAGLAIVDVSELQCDDPDEIALALTEVLKGQGKSAHRNVILLNTAVLLLLCDKVNNLKDGVEMAGDALSSGRVMARLQRIAACTHEEECIHEK